MKIKNKNGQLKIQEMAFVLVAVVFLFSIVFLFFVRFQSAQLTEQAQFLREYRSISMLESVAGMPELQCALQGKGVSVCIDSGKLAAFSGDSGLKQKYEEIWENSNIAGVSVEEVYPENHEYEIYKNDSNNTITYSTYVPLCSPEGCSIATIKISTIQPIQ